MSEKVLVRFEPAGRKARVRPGSTLLEAAAIADVEVDADCGGLSSCGACRVHAEGHLSQPTSDEREVLGEDGLARGLRLACRARVLGDSTVTVEVHEGEAVVVGATPSPEIAVEPPFARGIDGEGLLLGAAVDLGTTTLAVDLVDLRNGDVLASAGALNPQKASGADVMSRVTAALTGDAARLRDLAANSVEALLRELLGGLGARTEELREIAMVGNTAMTSLMLSADVTPLAAAPYEGAAIVEVNTTGAHAGLASFGGCQVYVPPGASAFVGADVVAGLVATGLADAPLATLFVDLGTNGEIAIHSGGALYAASTAAGPALEGAAIECGMRAEPGAIERVSVSDGGLRFDVLGGVEARGICGSGVLDLVAALLDAGVLDPGGRLSASSPIAGVRIDERDGVRVAVLEGAGDVVLSQTDVRQVQLAVGAVRTGIDLLLAETATRPDDVSLVIVAGGFGLHVSPDALVRIGLLPAVWRQRVTFAGNTALAGARQLLVSSSARARARMVAARVHTLNLAGHPEFETRFLGALEFPAS